MSLHLAASEGVKGSKEMKGYIKLATLGAFLILAGCKEALYTQLHEVEVNQMVAVLQAAEMSVSRRIDGDGFYSLMVEGDQVGPAVLLLQKEGLPRQKFSTLGEIFPDDGIVGTPFQERARFMHALNQELSETISHIEGVREARVHVVLPEPERFDREAKPASTAVAVYHHADFDAAKIVPTIKTLVAHSVPELVYEQVSVSLFEAPGAQLQINELGSAGAADASTVSAGVVPFVVPQTAANQNVLLAVTVLIATLTLFLLLRLLGGFGFVPSGREKTSVPTQPPETEIAPLTSRSKSRRGGASQP